MSRIRAHANRFGTGRPSRIPDLRSSILFPGASQYPAVPFIRPLPRPLECRTQCIILQGNDAPERSRKMKKLPLACLLLTLYAGIPGCNDRPDRQSLQNIETFARMYGARPMVPSVGRGAAGRLEPIRAVRSRTGGSMRIDRGAGEGARTSGSGRSLPESAFRTTGGTRDCLPA